MGDQVTLTLDRGGTIAKVEGARVCFSAKQCFAFDGGQADRICVEALAARLRPERGLAFYGDGPLFELLREAAPDLAQTACGVILDGALAGSVHASGLATLEPGKLPPDVSAVFLCETHAVQRARWRQRLPETLTILCPDVLAEVAPEVLPARAWTPTSRNIYPISLPEIDLQPGLDIIVMDCPARNLALMPNGLGYVHNALKNAGVKFQTFDLDIIAYHRFHMSRIYDEGGRVVLPSGKTLPIDPWQAEHYDQWADPEVMAYFGPIIDEAADAVIKASPRILGLSIQQCNEHLSRRLVNRVKEALPGVVILVGGFSCYSPDIGLRAFPEADYMCVGESDLTVGPLVRALAKGERPKNAPGVLSKFDDPKVPFIPAPMPHNLSTLPPPRYDWFSLDLYRNYNDYQLTPIIASRGCRWSRCTFCAERFYWRIRDPKEFVDELEWLIDQGCTLFMFNESDLNGMPEVVLQICDEIIRRGLKVKLTGQLRIHKKSDRAFFDKLHAAGFVVLRFGVDAFSENTLRLQKKGYTVDMVSQNLKDCWEAGIYTEVNWVIGVPGETEADVEEGIHLILKNRKYIGRLANINPLILVNGSVYWIDPKAHYIVFREPQEALYKRFPRAIPADLWHSENPFIDAQVRKQRFERIVLALHDAKFPVGAWAQRVIEDVRTSRDRNRAGAPRPKEAPPAWDAKQDSAVHQSGKKPLAATNGQSPAKTASGDPQPVGANAPPPPRLVRSLETHNIVFYDGMHYAAPKALGPLDLSEPDVRGTDGIVSDTDLEALVERVEEARRWANTRGQYEARDEQRRRGSLMKVDSALGEAENAAAPEQPEIYVFQGEHYAVERKALADMFDAGPIKAGMRAIGELARGEIGPKSALHRTLASFRPRARFPGGDGATHKPGAPAEGAQSEFRVLRAVTKNAVPELLCVIGNYNIVKFDFMCYGVPHGNTIDWGAQDPASVPGIVIGATSREVIARVAELTGRVQAKRTALAPTTENRITITGPADSFYTVPRRLGSVEGYSIVAYEGFVYGVPADHGELDFRDVDPMTLPGVIRDVSRDVVESEIHERRARTVAA